MTDAEAIRMCVAIRHYLTQGNPMWDVKDVDEALSMAINALDTSESASKIVFNKLRECELYLGMYDSKHCSADYMYGVCTVMEGVASMISEDERINFEYAFLRNMVKSEEKANEQANEKETSEANGI